MDQDWLKILCNQVAIFTMLVFHQVNFHYDHFTKIHHDANFLPYYLLMTCDLIHVLIHYLASSFLRLTTLRDHVILLTAENIRMVHSFLYLFIAQSTLIHPNLRSLTMVGMIFFHFSIHSKIQICSYTNYNIKNSFFFLFNF